MSGSCSICLIPFKGKEIFEGPEEEAPLLRGHMVSPNIPHMQHKGCLERWGGGCPTCRRDGPFKDYLVDHLNNFLELEDTSKAIKGLSELLVTSLKIRDNPTIRTILKLPYQDEVIQNALVQAILEDREDILNELLKIFQGKLSQLKIYKIIFNSTLESQAILLLNHFSPNLRYQKKLLLKAQQLRWGTVEEMLIRARPVIPNWREASLGELTDSKNRLNSIIVNGTEGGAINFLKTDNPIIHPLDLGNFLRNAIKKGWDYFAEEVFLSDREIDTESLRLMAQNEWEHMSENLKDLFVATRFLEDSPNHRKFFLSRKIDQNDLQAIEGLIDELPLFNGGICFIIDYSAERDQKDIFQFVLNHSRFTPEQFKQQLKENDNDTTINAVQRIIHFIILPNHQEPDILKIALEYIQQHYPDKLSNVCREALGQAENLPNVSEALKEMLRENL